MAAPDALPPAVNDWVERLRQIPDEARQFDVPPDRARLEFGIDDALARALVERGVPHAVANVGWLFAEVDLHYLTLRLGLKSSYRTAIGMWAEALASSRARASAPVEIRYVALVPPGSEVEVLVPPGERRPVTTEPDRTAVRVEATMRCAWPELDPAAREVLAEAAALDFCLLPESLELDAPFVQRTRLASCASAAQLIVRECTRRGVEARPAFGLLLGRPLATPRNWAEIRAGDDWVPVDPLLLATVHTYADARDEVWAPWRSPGAVLLRVARERAPIVSAGGGGAVKASFLIADAA
jgi:hypothetical protein